MAEAFNNMYYLERACQAQVAALGGGVKPLMPSAVSIAKTATLFHERSGAASRRDWVTLLWMLDRVDPSYRA